MAEHDSSEPVTSGQAGESRLRPTNDVTSVERTDVVPNDVRRLRERVGKTLRRGLIGGSSPASIIPVVAIALGTLLLAVQAALTGLWFAAAGTVLLGLALLVISAKVHKSATMTARLQRQVRDGLRGIGTAPAAASVSAGPLPASAVADRLKAIGKVVPQVMDSAAKGRQAAAVHADPQRAFRLYAATRGTVARTEPEAPGDFDAGGRRIAVIAGRSLTLALAGQFSVTLLHPGLAEAEFESAQPSALVIEERALQQGAWYSTMQASGVGLLREVLAMMSAARNRGISIYVIASNRLELSTTTVRRGASLVLSPDKSARELETMNLGTDAAARRPLIEILRSHDSSRDQTLDLSDGRSAAGRLLTTDEIQGASR